MFDKINKLHWISLDNETRNHLITVFGIPMTGIREVRDQTLISDGRTDEDLSVITGARMSEYVGSPIETGFPRLWELTLAKSRYELNPPVVDFSTDIIPTTPDVPTLSVKDNDGNELLRVESGNTVEIKNSFCNSCDSKGVRHKKDCVNYVPTRPEFVK